MRKLLTATIALLIVSLLIPTVFAASSRNSGSVGGVPITGITATWTSGWYDYSSSTGSANRTISSIWVSIDHYVLEPFSRSWQLKNSNSRGCSSCGYMNTSTWWYYFTSGAASGYQQFRYGSYANSFSQWVSDGI